MPFTLSHPAIVLPLTYLPRQWVSLTGVVIGSLTPDFEYFLRMRIKSSYSHTIDGIFWFDLPLALLLAFIFYNLVCNSLLDNLPTFLKSRFSALRQFDWNKYFKKNWIIVIVSVLIGATSHILWDNFTHEHGYFVGIVPSLINKISLFGGEISVLKILQHSSTFMGGVVIAFVIYKLPTDKVENGEVNLKYWAIFTGLTLTTIAIRLFCGVALKEYGNVIVTAISAGVISFILTPCLMRQQATVQRAIKQKIKR